MASGSRRRIGVLGAGASGMAAAWSLSRFPERYEVHVIEPGEEAGGVACSLRRSLGDGGENEVGVSINYGVQGGNSKAHQNTIEMLRLFGMDASPAELAVSFGKGEHNWKNYERKPLQTRLKGETARFGVVIKWIARLEFITIFLSIDFVLRLCLFSDAFRHRMVYPLVALFFGTGNQTPKVSAAVIARVFRDPSLALFEYDPEYLLSQAPKTIAFPELKELYSRMRQQAEATGGCTFHMRTQASRVRRTAHGVVVSLEAAPSTWRAGSDQTSGERTPATTTGEGWELALDEVIFACPANVALKILAEEASLAERWVLGSVEYFHDLTVTHTDHEYMQRHAEVDERAMYYIKTYDEKPECCEMGFHLTGYQPALQEARDKGHRIYQTIFLNRDDSHLWTIDQVDKAKILDKSWWVAFSHTFKHFRWVVPWVWTIQGRKHSLFAGSWTLFNTHDIAISSGLAAAQKLGAPYPFDHNELASQTFKTVLLASHLSTHRQADARRSKLN